MYRVSCPVEAFAVSWRGVESGPELLYPLLGACQAEDSLDIGRWTASAFGVTVGVAQLTLFLQVDAALGDHNWHVAVDVALSMLVKQGNRHVRIRYALYQRHAEDAGQCSLCV